MARVLYVIAWLVFALAVGSLVLSSWMTASVFQRLQNPLLLAGVLLALAVHLSGQAREARDRREKRSHFYLESCVKAYEEASHLLLDGNNDRAKWIAAGRALVHLKELSRNVTHDPHRRVLELHKLKYRKLFHDILSDKPASFFYGIEDSSVRTETAAAMSTAMEECAGRVTTSTVKALSEKSLHAIWEAAQWPKDYKDPLERDFSEAERAQLMVLFPGLHEYLEHKERWHSASGKLFPKNPESR